MKTNSDFIYKLKENPPKARNSRALIIVLTAMISLFLVFFISALSVTLENSELMGRGWTYTISWMWFPTFLFLSLSIMLAWAIFSNKKQINY